MVGSIKEWLVTKTLSYLFKCLCKLWQTKFIFQLSKLNFAIWARCTISEFTISGFFNVIVGYRISIRLFLLSYYVMIVTTHSNNFGLNSSNRPTVTKIIV